MMKSFNLFILDFLIKSDYYTISSGDSKKVKSLTFESRLPYPKFASATYLLGDFWLSYFFGLKLLCI